jgi:SMP-30/Gluconolactonase/LRE-like region
MRRHSGPVARTGSSWRIATVLAGLVGTAAVVGCSSDYPTVTDCEPGAVLTPDCRFHNPEDLVPSPAGGFMIVSQFSTMQGTGSGDLTAYDPVAGRIERLFPLDGAAPGSGDPSWGDPACQPPVPGAFSPHGIDIETRDDGRHALYVVNHGGRESVEMFEVHEDGQVRVTWRGCVVAPEQGYFNDVVVRRDGGFWVTHMYPRDANVLWAALRMQLTGYRPGFVYDWSPEQGFQKVAGTDTAFANGLEKSEDERFLFFNSYFGSTVNKVDTTTGELVGSAAVEQPDNLTWSPEGELLAASHHASIPDLLACQDIEQGSCGFRFQVVAIDPQSLETRVLLDHSGAPMGAATVALPFGDSVYLGTFAGNRIARAPASILHGG